MWVARDGGCQRTPAVEVAPVEDVDYRGQR